MPSRPTGSLALTLAAAMIGMAGAVGLAGLLHSPGLPARPLVEAWLGKDDAAGARSSKVAAAGDTTEPETTGTVVPRLRRGD